MVCAADPVQEFQQQPEGMPLTSAVWDLSNTLAPESLLQPISQLTCAASKRLSPCNHWQHYTLLPVLAD